MKKILRHLDEIIICMLLALICGVLILQIIFRWLLNSPLIWSEESARYMLVIMTMLAFGYNIRTDNNISMQLLYNRLPARFQKILTIAIDVVSLVMYVCLLPAAVRYTSSQIGVRSPTMRMPMVVLSGMVLLGIALAAVQVLFHIYRTAKSSGSGEGREE